MKYIFKLAYKNIIRAKKRTVLTFLALSFGVMFYVWMQSLLAGFDKTSFENVLNFETGHFKIRSLKYDEDKPFSLSNFIDNYAGITAALEKKDFVIGYTERIKFLAEIDNYIESTPVIVTGIDIERESSVFTTTNFITEGKLESGGGVLGKSLAEDMGVKLNDFVYITFRDPQGMITSVEVLITGIINTVDPIVNSSTLFIPIEDAKVYLNQYSVTEIAVKTDDFNKFKKYQKELEKDITGFQVLNWAELGAEFFALSEMKNKGSSMFALFIIIIALVGIINTVLISVYEKKREIGVLKALGMTDRQVLALFVIEGALIGLAGSIVGVILGALANWYFVVVGFDMGAYIGDEIDTGFRIMGVVKSVWSIKAFVNAVVVSVLASAVASFYPAKKATKMQPMECLRTNQ